MSEQPNDGKTEFILPIVCPHCKKELNLGTTFELLPPTESEEHVPPFEEEDEPTQEEEETSQENGS